MRLTVAYGWDYTCPNLGSNRSPDNPTEIIINPQVDLGPEIVKSIAANGLGFRIILFSYWPLLAAKPNHAMPLTPSGLGFRV